MAENIEFLDKQGFEKIDHIEELKTSRGMVDFYKKSENKYDQSSKITTPDLRYYWDGERFGLHISNWDYYKIKDLLFSLESERVNDCCEILYLARNNIKEFAINDTSLKKLSFLNLSGNKELKKVTLTCLPQNGLPNLKEIIVNDCPNLIEISFNGNYPLIKKIDLSNCSVKTFTYSDLPNLEYLNVQNNKIGEIDIARFKNLKYVFASGNQKLMVFWPKKWIHDKLEILGLDESNELTSKDILEIAKNSSDQDLRDKLKEYLKFEQKHDDELVPINRHQIILLGNTTAGKTELKHRLLKRKRTNHNSTHGVQYFLEKIGEIEVMGYDFGGQDYYHALHLPFFNLKSHYLIVWGNHTEKQWGNYDSDQYYGKTEFIEIKKGGKKVAVENLLYPLKYWLKSIQSHASQKNWFIINDSKAIRRENYNYSELIQQAKRDSKPVDIVEIENIVYKTRWEYEPIIDIIQNVRKGTKELYLDIKTLKSSGSVRVQDILSFNFLEAKVGNWLRKKIKSGVQTQKNQIVKSIKEFGEEIFHENVVLISQEDLIQRILDSKIKVSDSNFDVVINSLINNHYLIQTKNNYPHLKSYYIVNIQKFSEYIYQVLSKELAICEKNHGYFTKKEAFDRIQESDLEIKDFVIEFLKAAEVIFEVENSDEENPKYVAPNYLPSPKEKVEKLFIESFEKADCEFEFKDFFHPNIILKIVKHYHKKGLLVKDDEKIEYILWKNCVIIYNYNKNSKHFLKLELLLPNKDFPNRIPTFTIARSSSGFIENDQFYEVFNEIKRVLNPYTTHLKVKTKFGNYISFSDVQKLISEGHQKKSQFIYSEGVLYPKYDFRHFLGDAFDAPIKIFIAYSKFDDTYRLELRDHLNPGITEGKFVVFDDREMDMGEKWHARLKKELEECDVFILLISVKTLGTPYVMNVEIPAALDRMKNGSLKIIPVLVSQCDWTKTGLSELNIYDKANPIGSQNENLDLSKDLGVNERAYKWKEIVIQIEKIKPNGLNPPNSPASSDEHDPGAH